MGTTPHPLKIAKLADASRVEFGPLSFYHPLVADGDTPVRTGIQTAMPGYQAPMHWHPYTELLFIIEGEADVWLQGEEDASPAEGRRLRGGAARHAAHLPRRRRQDRCACSASTPIPSASRTISTARATRTAIPSFTGWRTNLNSTLSVV